MLRIWLCRARKETGELMASRLLAQRRTTCEEEANDARNKTGIVCENAIRQSENYALATYSGCSEPGHLE